MNAAAPDFSTTTVAAHKETIRGAQFLPGGTRILTNTHDGEMKVWDLDHPDLLAAPRPTCIQAFDHHNRNHRGVRVTADGRLAILYGANWTQIWNVQLGGWFADLTGEDEEFKTLAKNETLMVTEATWKHGGLRVWDLKRGQPIAVLRMPQQKISPNYHPAMEEMTDEEIAAHTPTAMITNVTLIGDAKLAVSTEKYSTYLFDLETLSLERELGYRVTALHSDGHTAFAAGSSPGLTAYDLFDEDADKINMDEAVGYYGRGEIACLADGRVVTTNETSIRVWQPGGWTCSRTFADAHAMPPDANPAHAVINQLVVLADGSHFATATPYDAPKVWDPDAGSKVAMALNTATGIPPGTERLTTHPLGLIGEVSNIVHVWNAETGAVIWSAPASHRLLDVAPNGRIACADGHHLVITTPVPTT